MTQTTFNVRVPDNKREIADKLRRRMAHYCIDNDVKQWYVVEQAIREFLNRKNQN